MFPMRLSALFSVLFLSVSLSAAADLPSVLGVTRHGHAIPCVLSPEALNPASDKPRVLLIGGLDGQAESVAAVQATLQEWDVRQQIGLAQDSYPAALP